MARISPTELTTIIETSITNTTPFIRTANLLVTEKLGGEGVSDAIMKEVELWLAAHFVAIRDPRIKSESLDDYKVDFHGAVGTNSKGLEATFWGQQALALDPTGNLARSGQKSAWVEAVSEY